MQLGEIQDFEDDNVVVTASLGNAEGLIYFDEDSLKLSILEGATNQ